MKNKISILTLGVIAILSGCGSKNGGVQVADMSLAGRLKKFPNNTVFASDTAGIDLKNENGKWKYQVKDSANNTFTFDVNELKKNGIFDETEFTKMNFGSEMDTKLKIVRNNELSYAHYGFLEHLTKDEHGTPVNVYNSFIMAQDDKEVDFVKPEQTTTFSGTTYAMLTKRKNGVYSYDTLTGTATMTVGANQSTADIQMAYNNWKTITAKNVNLENGAVGDWAVSDSNMGFFKETTGPNTGKHQSYLSITNLQNTEFVGSYRARLYENPITPTNKVSYTVDGVFGMKKQ